MDLIAPTFVAYAGVVYGSFVHSAPRFSNVSTSCARKKNEENTVEFDVLSLVAAHQSVPATYGVVSETVHKALCHIDVQWTDPVNILIQFKSLYSSVLCWHASIQYNIPTISKCSINRTT